MARGSFQGEWSSHPHFHPKRLPCVRRAFTPRMEAAPYHLAPPEQHNWAATQIIGLNIHSSSSSDSVTVWFTVKSNTLYIKMNQSDLPCFHVVDFLSEWFCLLPFWQSLLVCSVCSAFGTWVRSGTVGQHYLFSFNLDSCFVSCLTASVGDIYSQ